MTAKITVKRVLPSEKKWRFAQRGKDPWAVIVRRNWANDPKSDLYSVKIEGSTAQIMLTNEMIQSIATHLAKEHA